MKSMGIRANGSTSADSYAANSRAQNYAFHAYAKPYLAEALHLFIRMHSSTSSWQDEAGGAAEREETEAEQHQGVSGEEGGGAAGLNGGRMAIINRECRRRVTVADFGCSHGDNTLAYANFLVDGLTKGFLIRQKQPVSDNTVNIPRPKMLNNDPMDGCVPAAVLRPDQEYDDDDQQYFHDQGCEIGLSNVDLRPGDNGEDNDDESDKHATACNADDLRRDSIDDDDHEHLEIQYFFSDLASNDFNHLFQSLASSPLISKLCYVAGVPGSFYTRLFPKRSLNFVISAFSLHWLSQVPADVLDKSSPAWNGGHVWIWASDDQKPQVAQAFARQSMADLVCFLKCRAAEMVSNGVLFLFSPTRTQELPVGDYRSHHSFMWGGHFESTWNEMIDEGLITCEEKDTFNIPHYMFHHKELELALKEVPEFELVKLEILKDQESLPEEAKQFVLKNPQAFAKLLVGVTKSLAKPLVQEHIGLQRANIFFERLERMLIEKSHLSTTRLTYDILIAICKRC